MDVRRHPTRTTAFLAVALALAFADTAAAKDYWRYTDAGGNVHFVDARERIPAHLRGRARRVGSGGAAPVVNRMEARPAPARRPFSDVAEALAPARVVVYTAPWCGWCRKTLAWLDQRGVAYENRDIEAEPRYRAELVEKTGGSAIPVVEIGGQRIRGYQPRRWDELL